MASLVQMAKDVGRLDHSKHGNLDDAHDEVIDEAKHGRQRLAEVHVGEGLLVFEDGAPRSVVLLLWLGGLACAVAGSDCGLLERRSHVQSLNSVVGLGGCLAFVSSSHVVCWLPVEEGWSWVG